MRGLLALTGIMTVLIVIGLALFVYGMARTGADYAAKKAMAGQARQVAE